MTFSKLSSYIRAGLMIILSLLSSVEYTFAQDEPKENCSTTCQLMGMQCTDLNPLQRDEVCHCFDQENK
ncbi:hypothetical protein LRR18_17195, partial [Mangrovimonas sp. AS39]|uniref:hypothetical protein n=1 Tax=Mangrovimonas futianensis TaxID=2895523 RepID=UPI001E39BB8B